MDEWAMVAAELAGGTPTDDRVANFDSVARLYRWAEYLALGSLLRRTREFFLPRCVAAQHALVLGDGDGRFAAALLRQAPRLQLRAVDSSRAMLRLLERRCRREGSAHRVTIEYGLAPAILLQDPCDLIVTHFFLDCLTQAQVGALAERFARQAPVGCRWLLSDFGLPRGGFASLAARAYLRLLYIAFRILTGLPVQTLPDPQTALQAAGFCRLERKEWLGGFLYTELWVRGPGTQQAASAGATSLHALSST